MLLSLHPLPHPSLSPSLLHLTQGKADDVIVGLLGGTVSSHGDTELLSPLESLLRVAQNFSDPVPPR